MTHKLLAPLRVIESSAFIAAPLAGLTLAQFGADVIRVDLIGGGIDYGRMPRMPHPEGKGRSLYWTGLNKGKRSIAIDIRRPEGRELLRPLLRRVRARLCDGRRTTGDGGGDFGRPMARAGQGLQDRRCDCAAAGAGGPGLRRRGAAP
jgi:hypothetical protein